MHGYDALLWEDLDEIRSHTQKALGALQALERAIIEGHVGQPTRQDSKRLTQLAALTDLLQSEIGRWADELGLNGLHAGPIPSSNGKTAPGSAQH
jgi:hypothetical protein